MKPPNLNLREQIFLVADSNAYVRRLVTGILRGFGANTVLEVSRETELFKALTDQRVDILLCDAGLTPNGGLHAARTIRRNAENENRTMPIMIMTADARELVVKQARDAGANMVIAKPLSPAGLYDRLAWVAANRRQFVDTPNYFGPDRRFKIEGYPNGVGRRKGDQAAIVTEETGPALSQNDIDSLFTANRAG